MPACFSAGQLGSLCLHALTLCLTNRPELVEFQSLMASLALRATARSFGPASAARPFRSARLG